RATRRDRLGVAREDATRHAGRQRNLRRLALGRDVQPLDAEARERRQDAAPRDVGMAQQQDVHVASPVDLSVRRSIQSDGMTDTGKIAQRVQVWTLRTDGLTEAAVAPWLAILDEEERARAARFVFPRHRIQFTAAHALTRMALAQATGIAP